MTSSFHLTRRNALLGLSAAAITGCTTGAETPPSGLARTPVARDFALMYGPKPNEKFPLPAVNLKRVPNKFLRREVRNRTGEGPNTLIVNTRTFFLHHVQRDGTTMRYGVGLGREGFGWKGRAEVAWKRPWPTWTPPAEMIEREPKLAKYSAANGGMKPGLDNPLGARALYIFQDGVDTLYRLHGTPEYWTIGKAVSSGCVRLMNQDIIHLYDNVRGGTKLLVI